MPGTSRDNEQLLARSVVYPEH
uniref:Uncharacterized protein n=1 Tax=Arundo donax TaxID=35708 RepID=A0A0A9CD62_ARUDO